MAGAGAEVEAEAEVGLGVLRETETTGIAHLKMMMITMIPMENILGLSLIHI